MFQSSRLLPEAFYSGQPHAGTYKEATASSRQAHQKMQRAKKFRPQETAERIQESLSGASGWHATIDIITRRRRELNGQSDDEEEVYMDLSQASASTRRAVERRRHQRDSATQKPEVMETSRGRRQRHTKQLLRHLTRTVNRVSDLQRPRTPPEDVVQSHQLARDNAKQSMQHSRSAPLLPPYTPHTFNGLPSFLLMPPPHRTMRRFGPSSKLSIAQPKPKKRLLTRGRQQSSRSLSSRPMYGFGRTALRPSQPAREESQAVTPSGSPSQPTDATTATPVRKKAPFVSASTPRRRRPGPSRTQRVPATASPPTRTKRRLGLSITPAEERGTTPTGSGLRRGPGLQLPADPPSPQQEPATTDRYKDSWSTLSTRLAAPLAKTIKAPGTSTARSGSSSPVLPGRRKIRLRSLVTAVLVAQSSTSSAKRTSANNAPSNRSEPPSLSPIHSKSPPASGYNLQTAPARVSTSKSPRLFSFGSKHLPPAPVEHASPSSPSPTVNSAKHSGRRSSRKGREVHHEQPGGNHTGRRRNGDKPKPKKQQTTLSNLTTVRFTSAEFARIAQVFCRVHRNFGNTNDFSGLNSRTMALGRSSGIRSFDASSAAALYLTRNAFFAACLGTGLMFPHQFLNRLWDVCLRTTRKRVSRTSQDFHTLHITYEAYIKLCWLLLRGTPDDKFQFAYECYDFDGDGVVTEDDVFQLWHCELDSMLHDDFRPFVRVIDKKGAAGRRHELRKRREARIRRVQERRLIREEQRRVILGLDHVHMGDQSTAAASSMGVLRSRRRRSGGARGAHSLRVGGVDSGSERDDYSDEAEETTGSGLEDDSEDEEEALAAAVTPEQYLEDEIDWQTKHIVFMDEWSAEHSNTPKLSHRKHGLVEPQLIGILRNVLYKHHERIVTRQMEVRRRKLLERNHRRDRASSQRIGRRRAQANTAHPADAKSAAERLHTRARGRKGRQNANNANRPPSGVDESTKGVAVSTAVAVDQGIDLSDEDDEPIGKDVDPLDQFGEAVVVLDVGRLERLANAVSFSVWELRQIAHHFRSAMGGTGLWASRMSWYNMRSLLQPALTAAPDGAFRRAARLHRRNVSSLVGSITGSPGLTTGQQQQRTGDTSNGADTTTDAAGQRDPSAVAAARHRRSSVFSARAQAALVAHPANLPDLSKGSTLADVPKRSRSRGSSQTRSPKLLRSHSLPAHAQLDALADNDEHDALTVRDELLEAHANAGLLGKRSPRRVLLQGGTQDRQRGRALGVVRNVGNWCVVAQSPRRLDDDQREDLMKAIFNAIDVTRKEAVVFEELCRVLSGYIHNTGPSSVLSFWFRVFAGGGHIMRTQHVMDMVCAPIFAPTDPKVWEPFLDCIMTKIVRREREALDFREWKAVMAQCTPLQSLEEQLRAVFAPEILLAIKPANTEEPATPEEVKSMQHASSPTPPMRRATSVVAFNR